MRTRKAKQGMTNSPPQTPSHEEAIDEIATPTVVEQEWMGYSSIPRKNKSPSPGSTKAMDTDTGGSAWSVGDEEQDWRELMDKKPAAKQHPTVTLCKPTPLNNPRAKYPIMVNHASPSPAERKAPPVSNSGSYKSLNEAKNALQSKIDTVLATEKRRIKERQQQRERVDKDSQRRVPICVHPEPMNVDESDSDAEYEPPPKTQDRVILVTRATRDHYKLQRQKASLAGDVDRATSFYRLMEGEIQREKNALKAMKKMGRMEEDSKVIHRPKVHPPKGRAARATTHNASWTKTNSFGRLAPHGEYDHGGQEQWSRLYRTTGSAPMECWSATASRWSPWGNGGKPEPKVRGYPPMPGRQGPPRNHWA